MSFCNQGTFLQVHMLSSFEESLKDDQPKAGCDATDPNGNII